MAGNDNAVQRQLNTLTREVHALSQRIEALAAALNANPRMYDEPPRADGAGRPFAPGTGTMAPTPPTPERLAAEAALEARDADG